MVLTTLESKSGDLPLPRFVDYLLPTLFFFHMSYYYAPDKFKLFCQVSKYRYTINVTFWIVSCIINELLSTPEKKFFE